MNFKPKSATHFRQYLDKPFDISALAFFRVAFGLLMFVSTVRFIIEGWVTSFFVQRDFFFKFWGFEWVEVFPPTVMYVLFIVLAISALGIALGLFYRICAPLFFLIFTYVELIDVTNYLNHYYLVSLLSFWVAVLPLHSAYSLDVLRKPAIQKTVLPAWMTYVFRFQVSCVYIYAAIAKVGPDWLLYGQPLNIWLSSKTEIPVLGPYLSDPSVALILSWLGFLNDLLIVPGLLYSKTRPYAYSIVAIFHILTRVFFNIGMFPWIMLTTALVFFSPSWPRKIVKRFPKIQSWLKKRICPKDEKVPLSFQTPRTVFLFLLLYGAFQILFPLRSHAYGGNVLWHEQGMRFSWKVLVRQKNGTVTFRVRWKGLTQEKLVYPRSYLTRTQEYEMLGQPDLILKFAKFVGRTFEDEGFQNVEVRADAFVSLNGRKPERLIDPNVNLVNVEHGFSKAKWILPGPNSRAPQLGKSVLLSNMISSFRGSP